VLLLFSGARRSRGFYRAAKHSRTSRRLTCMRFASFLARDGVGRKKSVVAIVDRCGNFTFECVPVLNKECSIRRADMHHIGVCYEMAKENPSHLDMGAPTKEYMIKATRMDDIVATRTAVVDVTNSLNSLTLKPNGMKGEKNFDHIVTPRKQHAKSRLEEPSPFFRR